MNLKGIARWQPFLKMTVLGGELYCLASSIALNITDDYLCWLNITDDYLCWLISS